ncbi:MAG: aminotransferase class V-fold PLP-dependent enzyme, partial [Myxococcota bacterium]
MDLDHIRREFADFRGWLYFNAARQGPLPERSRRAAERAVAAFSRPAEFDDDERFSGDARVRTGFARLTGAHPSEIAIGTGTGFGLGLAATCLPQPGDEVLIGPSEYLTLPTSFVTAAKQHEFSVRRMSPAVPFFSVEDVEAALTPRTRVVALSAVSYDRGYRADLEAIGELCRRRDLYFVVDACQAAGSVPLDVSRLNVDVLATGAYKWLLSPYGTGLAYFSERARAHMVSPTPSNHSVEAYEWPQLELAEEARGLDVPQAPTPMLMWPLAESLELILEEMRFDIHDQQLLMLLF